LLRFIFFLGKMSVRIGSDPTAPTPSLDAYTEDRRITWLGQDGRETVTVFVVNPSATKVIDGFDNVASVPVLPGGKFTIGGS
jgi:hypothetical protein